MSAPPASQQHIPLKEIDDEHILKEIDEAVNCQWTFSSQGYHPLATLLERMNVSQGRGWLRNVVCKGQRQKKSGFSSEEKEYLKLLGSKIPESIVGRLKTLLGTAWGSAPATMKKYLGDPLQDPSLYNECQASSWHAAEVVESFAVSETLTESRGIEVEVEGNDSNDESSLEAVATTITPTPKAHTLSFFGREGNEEDRLALLVDSPVVQSLLSGNKDDEGLLDTHKSDNNEGEINLLLPDEDEPDVEQEEGPDEELEPSSGEPSDTADPNQPNRTTTIRTEPTLLLPIPPKQISREAYEVFQNMRTRKRGVGIPEGMRHCAWTDPKDEITYYFLCEKGFHVEVHTRGEEKRPYVIPSRYKQVDKTAETKEKKKSIAAAEAQAAEYEARTAEAGRIADNRVQRVLQRQRFGFSEF
jgi:hypothetical protein